MEQPHVSILESVQAIAQSLARTLQAEGLQQAPADMTGLELQHELAARQWSLPVMFLAPSDDITTAVWLRSRVRTRVPGETV
jgi:hypothetical protein